MSELNMSPAEHTNVLETPQDSMVAVLSRAPMGTGTSLDEFMSGLDMPIDLTLEGMPNEITNNAIADAALIVAKAEEQAAEICKRSCVKVERLISAAAATIEEQHASANETLAALSALADSRVAEAEKKAAAIVKQANVDAVEIADRSEQEARDLSLSAQERADQLLEDAQIKADEIVESVEELKTTAHARLATAVAEATERGAAIARTKINAQLIDTRRETHELEGRIAAMRAELAEGESRCDAPAPVMEQAA